MTGEVKYQILGSDTKVADIYLQTALNNEQMQIRVHFGV